MWFDYLLYILFGIGVFFNLLGSLGLLRFPDVYTRLHAGTKCTTFGSIFLIGSVILMGVKTWFVDGWTVGSDGSVLAFHAAAALVAILLTNPTGAHAIARAAYKSGVKPVGAVVDALDKPKSKKTSPRKKTTSKKTKEEK